MDDKQKDVAIIEASALLVTLIFIILSFYTSSYALYYTTWQTRCTLNPQECTWPPWLAAFSALVGTLEPYTYAVGFFFVVAAFTATLRLFEIGRGWLLAGLQKVEFLFFGMGLVLLAIMFFAKAPRDVYTLAWIAFVTLGMIGGPLLYAYHRRHALVSEPL